MLSEQQTRELLRKIMQDEHVMRILADLIAEHLEENGKVLVDINNLGEWTITDLLPRDGEHD